MPSEKEFKDNENPIGNKEDFLNYFRGKEDLDLNNLDFEILFNFEEAKSVLIELFRWMLKTNFRPRNEINLFAIQNVVSKKLNMLKKISETFNLLKFEEMLNNFINYIETGTETIEFSKVKLNKNFVGWLFIVLHDLFFAIAPGYYSHNFDSYIISFNHFINLIITFHEAEALSPLDSDAYGMDLDEGLFESEEAFHIELTHMEQEHRAYKIERDTENLKIIDNAYISCRHF